MNGTVEDGEVIHKMLEEMIAGCCAQSMPLPYVIVLVPASCAVTILRVTEHTRDVMFKQPSDEKFVASPIDVLVVDANGGSAHFKISESGQLTIH